MHKKEEEVGISKVSKKNCKYMKHKNLEDSDFQHQ